MAVLCEGGLTLRGQLDRRFKKRDRRSDGWIGDVKHQKRGSLSDHNPDPKTGIVHAIDVDENFGKGRWRNGRNAQNFANQLIKYAASGLPGSDRIKYVVYEQRISSGTYKNTWWTWRGTGYGHTQHVHVSFTAKADRNGALFPLPILGRSLKTRLVWWRHLRAR